MQDPPLQNDVPFQHKKAGLDLGLFLDLDLELDPNQLMI